MRGLGKKLAGISLVFMLLLTAAGCGSAQGSGSGNSSSQSSAAQTESAETAAQQELQTAESGEESEAASEESAKGQETEKNGDVYILYTSDVHCGIDQGFGYAGLAQVRDSLEAQGFTTILVDNGDSIQGEPVGTLSRGEEIINLMNALKYDVAIPGNHEFDYGMDRFLELTKMAEFPYISCNFNREGELVFEPYVIKEAAGMKIAFVGVTTPLTLVSSTPKYFRNEKGELIYGFMQDETGEALYEAVQKAVDAARADGADYVYIMGHMGLEAEFAPWTYADVIAHTNGIDVFLDGHSHDSEQVVMKNKDGEDVVRTACGTKLASIGYSHISAEEGIVDTNIWSWPNGESVPSLLSIQNPVGEVVNDALVRLDDEMGRIVAKSSVDLLVTDPVQKDASGSPIRMIRRAETNLGDLVADAVRAQTGADVAVMNGGGVRDEIRKGDVTYGDIIKVHPFGNEICMIKVTGQQILDALEWGARAVPGESGAFLHVSGMKYEIDVSVDSGCKEDENGMLSRIEGERRVKNVYVGEEALDPEKTYTVGGTDYTLLKNGDGTTAFDGSEVLLQSFKLDNQMLIDYITETLGGEVGEEYADPYGQGRITITGE